MIIMDLFVFTIQKTYPLFLLLGILYYSIEYLLPWLFSYIYPVVLYPLYSICYILQALHALVYYCEKLLKLTCDSCQSTINKINHYREIRQNTCISRSISESIIKMCVICEDEAAIYAPLPCGHLCIILICNNLYRFMQKLQKTVYFN